MCIRPTQQAGHKRGREGAACEDQSETRKRLHGGCGLPQTSVHSTGGAPVAGAGQGGMSARFATESAAASSPMSASFPPHIVHWCEREAAFLSQDRLQPHETEVTPTMRWMLINFLADVVIEQRLGSATFFLGVHCLDRIIATRPIERQSLQCVGLACMWIAAKYEETLPPKAEKMSYMANNAVSVKDLLAEELSVLAALDYDVGGPTSLTFLCSYFERIPDLPGATRALAIYLIELALLDATFTHCLPSLLAAAALKLSLILMAQLGYPVASVPLPSIPTAPVNQVSRSTHQGLRQMPAGHYVLPAASSSHTSSTSSQSALVVTVPSVSPEATPTKADHVAQADAVMHAVSGYLPKHMRECMTMLLKHAAEVEQQGESPVLERHHVSLSSVAEALRHHGWRLSTPTRSQQARDHRPVTATA